MYIVKNQHRNEENMEARHGFFVRKCGEGMK
jgi:hypothetical protein